MFCEYFIYFLKVGSVCNFKKVLELLGLVFSDLCVGYRVYLVIDFSVILRGCGFLVYFEFRVL